jgi:multidrug efflux pump subunit AcrA (membrane-fusion protein)
MLIRKFTVPLLSLYICSILFYSCGSDAEVRPLVKDVQELVFASGSIEWDDSYNVTAQTDGILKDATFEIGKEFLAGEIMARIDNASNQINVSAASEQLSIAAENAGNSAPLILQLEQSIQFAEEKHAQDVLQVKRMSNLYAAQSASKLELENAQLAEQGSLTNLQSVKKQLLQVKSQAKQNLINADAQFKNAKILGAYNLITATEKGLVIKKLKSTGDFVKKGDVIAVLANNSEIQVVLNVDEKSISKVKIGQPVFIRLNTNIEKVLKAELTEIQAAFNEQTQSFICKAAFKGRINGLLFGTQLEANILVAEKKNALVVPRNYVGYGNIIQLKNKDVPIKVKTGIVSSEYVEITGGMKKDAILVPLKP